MQIIEVTDLWVRSGVVRFEHPNTPLRFVVYPMIHMAQASFYAQVTARLRQADVVVAEGVGGGDDRRGSVLLSALTLSYRVLRLNRRTQLVRQDIDYAALDAEIVRPDLSAAEFREGWRRVPLGYRVILWLALPVVILVRLLGGTRRIWTTSMERNDLPSSEDEEMAGFLPELHAAFHGERDNRLLAALRKLHDERRHERIEVAVVYGAAHVPAVAYGLMDLGYRPRASEWLVVADV